MNKLNDNHTQQEIQLKKIPKINKRTKLILQFFIICLIISYFIIYDFKYTSRFFLIYKMIFFITYFTYVYVALNCSETYFYLSNNYLHLTIDQYLNSIFNEPPNIVLIGENYIVRRHYFDKEEITTSRVHTHTDKQEFNIFSSKDVSQWDIWKCKGLLKLTLNLEVSYNDVISQLDYENFKASFWDKNKNKINNEFILTEEVFVKGLNHHMLIKISDYEYPCINKFCYMLCSFIPVIEFYKYYFNRICEVKEFTIKKVFSTRYDLNNEEEESEISNINL